MDSNLTNRIITVALILFVATPVLFGIVTYLWNKKYVPYKANRGKTVRGFGRWLKEINNYVFKEDKKTLLKKGPPLLQKLFSLRSIHFLLIAAGIIGAILTGQMLLLLTLPLSFLLGVGRAVPRILERQKMLDRIFSIAGNSIKFTTSRGRSQPPPASWNFMNASEWNENGIPEKIIINFPAGAGPEINGQKTFQKTFEQMVTDNNIWVYEWDLPGDKVTIQAVNKLPTQLAYPGSKEHKWSVFPIGQTAGGEASYDVSQFPHALVAGPSGTGKSVLQRNIVFHCIQHNDRWRFLGIDLKMVELTPYNVYKKTVMGVATDVEQGLEVLKYANNEMMDRYKMMQENKVNNIMDLPDGPPAILIMIDEATMFLSMSGSKTEEGKAIDAMKAEASDLVGKILRLGRASAIHMLIAMQRPDAEVLKGEYKANMDVRMAAGRMDSTPSSMVLDSAEAANLPGIRGRGLLRVGGSLDEFQGYFAPQDWMDNIILENPSLEPSTVAPGGHLYEKYQALQKTKRASAEGSELESDGEDDSPIDMGKTPVDYEQEIPPAESAAPASLPTLGFDKPDENMLPVEVEATPNENQQNLVDALNKPAEFSGGESSLPTFFTNSEPEATPVATGPDLNVTPDVEAELAGNDNLMDDYSDLDDVLNQNAGIPITPAAPVTPAEKPAAVKWEPVSPFGNPVGVTTPVVAPQPVTTAPVTPVTPPEESTAVQPTAKASQPLPARPGGFPTRPTRPTRPNFPTNNE